MEHKSILLLIFFRIYVASAIFQSYFAEKTNLWYCSDETENTAPLAPQAKSLTNKPPLMSFDFYNHAEQVATWNRQSQSLSSIFFALCVTMLILSCDLFLIFIHVLVILLCTHQQCSRIFIIFHSPTGEWEARCHSPRQFCHSPRKNVLKYVM